MAYDVDLADRVRELLVDGSPVTEQKMFGALADDHQVGHRLPKKWHIERIDKRPS